MSGITHKQAQRYLSAAADGILRDDQRALLDAHLRDCVSCRMEAEKVNTLETRLKQTFHARWDIQDGPYKNVKANIHSRTGRVMMSNRLKMGLRFLAGVVLLLGLVIVFNAIFSHWRTSPAITATSTISPTGLPATVSATPQPYNGLIAFVSEKSGNSEIYTMHSDGTNITNLTNNPSNDGNPIWSPDGKRIAFESNRDGHVHILTMNADGSDIVRLMNDNADDQLGLYYGESANIWSPDGSKLIITRNPSKTDNLIRYIVNADGSGATQLEDNAVSPVWSPDGKQIAYAVENPQNPDRFQVYVANADGSNCQSIINNPDLFNVQENAGDIVMKWSADGQNIYFMLTSSPYEDGMRWRIFQVNINGKNAIQLATSTSPIDGWSREIPSLVYPTLNPQGWNWFRTDGKNKTYLKKWNPIGICGDPTNYFDTFASPNVSYLWSPDKTKLAVGVYCDKDKGWWFFLLNADNLEVSQLTNAPFYTNDTRNLQITSWSPYNKSILFTIQNINNIPIGNVDIYTLDMKGGNTQPIQLTSDNLNSGNPAWQPRP
jgi:Tol biopolymer transport system component